MYIKLNHMRSGKPIYQVFSHSNKKLASFLYEYQAADFIKDYKASQF